MRIPGERNIFPTYRKYMKDDSEMGNGPQVSTGPDRDANNHSTRPDQ